MKKKHRAVFLDRDGTINVYKLGYLWKVEDFEWIPEAKEGLQILSKTDYKIIIITNQSGVGRGYYTKEDVERLHEWLKKECEALDIRIDGIYYCPHHPDEGCLCRKPNPGMLLQAAKELEIDLEMSWMVGDNPKDIAAGLSAGLKTIQVENKKLREEVEVKPHKSVKHLKDAVHHIMRLA